MTQTQIYKLTLLKQPIFLGFEETLSSLKDDEYTVKTPTTDWSVLYGTLSNGSVYKVSEITETILGTKEYLLSWFDSVLKTIGTPLTELSQDVEENKYVAEYNLDENRIKPLYLLLPILTASFTPISNLVCKQLYKELEEHSQSILKECSEEIKETYYIFLEAFKEASQDRTSFTFYKET